MPNSLTVNSQIHKQERIGIVRVSSNVARGGRWLVKYAKSHAFEADFM